MSNKKAEYIIEMIIREAENEAKKILSEAKKKAERIVKDAEEKLKRSVEERVKKTFVTVTGEEIRRKVAEAKLEAKRMILNAKEEAIKKVLDATIEQLKKITTTEGYTKILEKLIYEAGEALGGGELIVELSKKDEKLKLDWKKIAKKIEEDTGVKTIIKKVNTNLDCIGGVIVKSADGKITFDNTFEEKINRLERRLRVIIAQKLFGG
ncbi:MAG: V-type ATP synthase subunit E family protein [archaeon GB-1867-035]|nr:V-type ATP synthase subunit E family protein [Candidatus Culexmicrobium profundum]